MKIFVGFFGLPRCSAVTMPSIEQHILAPCERLGELQIGYHLYHQQQVDNPRSGEQGDLPDTNYDWFRRHPGVIEPASVAPVQAEHDALMRYGDPFDDGYRSYRNLLMQLHSLRQLSAQAHTAGADVVLYLRPDLYYHDPLEPAVIKACARDTRKVFVPDWQWGFGINDRFGICGRDASPAYGQRLTVAARYCSSMQAPLHSESLLQHVLRSSEVRLRTTRLRASRVRIAGQMKPENFEPLQTIIGGRRRRWGLQITRALSRLV